MKRSLFSPLIIGLIFFLSGCITEFTPRNTTIELLPGESQIFTALSDEESASMVWYLDGEQVADDATQYEFVAEQIDSDEPVVHTLKVQEDNPSYQRYLDYLGLTANPDSITWTIRILPPAGPTTCYLDEDGDGYGDITKEVVSETPPDNCVDNSDDCDDSQAAVNPDAEEQCDGIDNNCDGTLDPDGCCTNGDTQATTCGLGECASSGEVTCQDGVWDDATDTCTPGIPSEEVCDGLDNDCNGSVDDGIELLPTSCGMGQCARTGVAACVDGATIDNCTPGTPTAEVFDGLDNDCDGQIDEDFAAECAPGDASTEISCGTGACAATGLRSCIDGQWVNNCTPGTPKAEVCDGVDNNCNGSVDDGIAQTETTCGVGQCGRTGSLTCVAGAMVDSCTPGMPTTEILDSQDNDCDGQIDEDFGSECSPGDPATEISCGTGACAATGLRSCIDGYWVNDCTPGDPTAEVCDGIDNNCNGTVDDGIAQTETTCGVGQCGSTGTLACVDGAMVDSCAPGTPADEICDGLDNNCNGSVDEGIAQTATTCGLGECGSTGALACVDGAMVDSCTPGTPVDEICDGLDNNCNGTVDDGIAQTETTCGVGQCGSTGTLACVDGAMVDSCAPGTPADEICDGLDNNCDGSVDEGIAQTETTCGLGECGSTGTLACVDGAMVDSCTPGTPVGEICDGLDNNCNGSVDEGIAEANTTCGVGECGSTGMLSCVDGAMVDSCTPGDPVDEICDGLDNNCNGSVDDGIAQTETTCGIGECGSTGMLACVNGAMVDSCTAGTPVDEICDGLDNNCNGSVDDGIAQTETTCGIGECGSTGTLACVDGAMVDSCAPGTPTDEICDGLDNNCNGTVDDGLTDEPTTCGIGECGSTGLLTCIDGAVIDTCDPGTPMEEACDGLDNDCNGTADDGIAETATTCGVGECGSTGILACIDGAMVDSCVPGLPAEAEVCLDGLDNDCNGSVDDGCDENDPDQLAEDGLNLLIDYLQAYLISGETPEAIEDILPPAALNDIRTNYFEAALVIDSENPSAHFGLAVLEYVNIAYDTDFNAIIDILFDSLTGNDTSGTSNTGTAISLLFKFLDTNATGYLTAILDHLNYAGNLDTDIVLQLHMPLIMLDDAGNPVLDPETGLQQFVRDEDGNVVYDEQKSSYQLDRTDVLMMKATAEFGLGALHLYKAYDVSLADANGSYDYLDEIVLADENGVPDFKSFQGMFAAQEYNDKRDSFLTLLPGGATEAQASKVAFLGAIADQKAALDSLSAETDDQADDINTIERMGGEKFSIADAQARLDKLAQLVNSSASNRYEMSFSVLDQLTIDMGIDLSGVFSGAITDLHQYLPYHYWFHLDQSTAYPANAQASWSEMVDQFLGLFYGLSIPIPLYADERTPPAGDAEFAATPYLLGRGMMTPMNGFMKYSSIKMNLMQLSVDITLCFPDTTFGGIVQGLSQDDIDAMFAVMTDISNFMPPTEEPTE